jgi:hypothetical protein
VARRSARIALLLVGAALVAWLVFRATWRPFPADTTPEGAYLRIALAMSNNAERDVFPYLETDAQWAAFSIRDMRREALALVVAHYPAGEGDALASSMRREAGAADGPDVFVILSEQKGFGARLRRDLSGIASVEIDGPRASVVTSRGTRYPFRRRDNGIWGLTSFTAELVAERERAARDLAVVRAAAADYARAAGQSLSTGSPSRLQPGSTTRPN